jgi:YidC/Oxa1 family membrane protein insertase
MEKRALIAIAISFLILLAWGYIFPPAQPPEPTTPAVVEEPGQEPDRSPVEPTLGEAATVPSVPEAAEDAPAVAAERLEEVRVDNNHFSVLLTNRGGAARSWRLREYTTDGDEPLELIASHEGDVQLPLSLELDDLVLTEALNTALYEVERRSVTARGSGGRGERITFRWSDGRGLVASKSFTFWQDGWLIDVDIQVSDRGRRLPARLALGPGFGAQEVRTGRSTYAYDSQGVWNVSGSVTRRKKKKLNRDPGGFSAELRWAGLEDQYFAALVLPDGGPTQVRWRAAQVTPLRLPGEEASGNGQEQAAVPVLSVSVPESGARVFIGPKSYRLLRRLGTELERVVWFATNTFLAAISKYIFFALVWIHDHVVSNYGLAIILATALLRVLLFPVNQYSMVNMKKMQLQSQRLQPKMKAIRAKYQKKKDATSRQKMNDEIMALYKREGINPAGQVTGCLPLLAQFPILIGFYNMLTVAVELRGAAFFGWIQDLSQKDPYWVIPLLMGATMFVQQKMAMSKVKDPTMQQQQRIMMFMPFFFTWICLQMPSGMVLYWFVNNLLGIGQQWLVNRHTGRLEAAAQKA